jgi:ketosteroid isomerase-like protein
VIAGASNPGTRVAPPEQEPVKNFERARAGTPEKQKDSRDEVGRMIYRWSQTLTSRNVDAHVKLYAQKLDRFYDRTNVSKDAVLREKQSSFSQNSLLPGQQIRDVALKTQDGGDLVIAEFRRAVKPGGEAPSQMVHQRLVFKRIGGDWKIIREEAL